MGGGGTPVLAALELLLGPAPVGGLFLWATSGPGSPAAQGSQLGQGAEQRALAANSSLLYECELSYVQVDMSWIKFSINYLEFQRPQGVEQANSSTQPSEGIPFRLAEIDYEWTPRQVARLTRLNATEPFVFFINGFNTFKPYDGINATWMYDVARNFAQRPGVLAGERVIPARNVLFLTWSIPELFASNLLSMIPAYYKTVANYDLIMGCVTRTLAKLIAFVDMSKRFTSATQRADHFRQWHFYGHSLGSHILSDAISRLAGGGQNFAGATLALKAPNLKGAFKFGKLMGLDPATPCFVSREYGISSSKVAKSVHEVMVLHSNAGFAGLPNERANLEIVLNGGTFQPGCVWYDFTCHHVRSTDILSYIDDQCQMVAYKCTSYHHFKLGACETCYGEPPPVVAAGHSPLPARLNFEDRTGVRNCVLVNLPEQHRDSRAILDYAEQFNDEQRQLAEADAPSHPIGIFRRLNELERKYLSAPTGKPKNTTRNPAESRQNDDEDESHLRSKGRKSYYHFVSTSPNFRFGRKSHCLQHYQLRLLIYNSDEQHNSSEKCKLSSFLVAPSDGIELKLYYEIEPSVGELAATRSEKTTKLVLDPIDPRQLSSRVQLNAIIKDLFHTALVNFEGPPRVFTGAELVNVDFGALRACLRQEAGSRNSSSATGLNFVLDIAFMSHTNYKIRNAFSSVLCGQLDVGRRVNATRSEDDGQDFELMLKLCKRSDLTDSGSHSSSSTECSCPTGQLLLLVAIWCKVAHKRSLTPFGLI